MGLLILGLGVLGLVLVGCGEPTCKDGSRIATNLVGSHIVQKWAQVDLETTLGIYNRSITPTPNNGFIRIEKYREYVCKGVGKKFIDGLILPSESQVVLKDYNEKTGRSTCEQRSEFNNKLAYKVEYTVQNSDKGILFTLVNYKKLY